MADEGNAQAQEGQQAQQGQPDDWQAKYEAMRQHSREWEKKAKANEDAADELEKLKAAQMSEQEKANKRAEKAEAELNELKAKAERAETVAKVADEANVPAEFVAMLTGADADELAKQVARILELLPAYPTRTDDGGAQASVKTTNADRFAKTLFG